MDIIHIVRTLRLDARCRQSLKPYLQASAISYFYNERCDELIVGDPGDCRLGEGGLGDGLGHAAEGRGGRGKHDPRTGSFHRDPDPAFWRVAVDPRATEEVRRYHRLELLVRDRPRLRV